MHSIYITIQSPPPDEHTDRRSSMVFREIFSIFGWARLGELGQKSVFYNRKDRYIAIGRGKCRFLAETDDADFTT